MSAYRDDPAGNMADLAERLARAAAEIAALRGKRSRDGEYAESHRLAAKREGVLLALDYLRSYEVLS